MNWFGPSGDCGCCGDGNPCDGCSATPDQMTLIIPTDEFTEGVNGTGGCSQINGTHTLDQDAGDACSWSKSTVVYTVGVAVEINAGATGNTIIRANVQTSCGGPTDRWEYEWDSGASGPLDCTTLDQALAFSLQGSNGDCCESAETSITVQSA